MSSKRRLRRKCEKKIKHSTLEHANIAIKKAEHTASLRAYKCPFCNKWHIGRIPLKYCNHIDKI
jgi:hypothetical protein